MQIEEGKFYRTRDGDKIGPMRHVEDSTKRYPIRGNNPYGCERSFTSEGRFFYGVDKSNYDLVAEWTEGDNFVVERGDGRDFVIEKCTLIDPAADPCVDPAADPVLKSDPHYASLAGALQAALDQAATGKGSARHSDGDTPFLEQPIMEIARMLGDTGGHSYQIMKKAQEANRMVRRGQYDAAVSEYLGVVNYAAAAILLIREL